MDCDTVADESGGTEDTQTQNDAVHENDPVEIPVPKANPVVAPEANTAAGSPVENEEEAPDENKDTEEVIDEMIDELSDEVILRGEAMLEEAFSEKDESDDSTEEPVEWLLRPTREKQEPTRLTHGQTLTGKKHRKKTQSLQLEHKHNLFQQSAGKDHRMECRDDECLVVARFLDDIQEKFGLGQQHTLAKGLKKFGEKGVCSAEKEVGHSRNRACFRPIWIQDMTHEERRRAQMARRQNKGPNST